MRAATALSTSAIGSSLRQRSTPRSTAAPSRRFRQRFASRGVTHRRSGYRDPESRDFIESWFGKRKERLVWRTEFETLNQVRPEIVAYLDSYHRRPHSGLDYRTPAEVRRTCDNGPRQINIAA